MQQYVQLAATEINNSAKTILGSTWRRRTFVVIAVLAIAAITAIAVVAGALVFPLAPVFPFSCASKHGCNPPMPPSWPLRELWELTAPEPQLSFHLPSHLSFYRCAKKCSRINACDTVTMQDKTMKNPMVANEVSTKRVKYLSIGPPHANHRMVTIPFGACTSLEMFDPRWST